MSNFEIDRRKWRQLSIFEQMGNIGSEVGRALSAHRRDDSRTFLEAFGRGMDLFDATIETWAAKRDAARLREILYAREQFVEVLLYDKDDAGLEKYFMEFAMAARLRQSA